MDFRPQLRTSRGGFARIGFVRYLGRNSLLHSLQLGRQCRLDRIHIVERKVPYRLCFFSFFSGKEGEQGQRVLMGFNGCNGIRGGRNSDSGFSSSWNTAFHSSFRRLDVMAFSGKF